MTGRAEAEVSSQNMRTILTTLFIGVTYLWTASAYLSWTNRLTPLADETVTYLATEAGGCVTQIIGLGLFAWLLKRDHKTALNSRLIILCMVFDGCCILPILLSGEMMAVLLWGLAMNLFHGVIAARYIAGLSYYIPKNRRAFCFGVGYAFGSIGSYPLSRISDHTLSGAGTLWIAFAFLIFLSILLVVFLKKNGGPEAEPTSLPPAARITKNGISFSSRILAGAVVVLLGLAIQLMFFFPAMAYLNNVSILRFAHMFYAIGLIIAAVINDKKRNAGLILALLSLCFPLLSLSLYQFSGLLTFLTIIGKIATGFYAVHRILVFADLYDNDSRLLALSPMGLLCGRAGEAVGATLGFVIGSDHILLTFVTALLFSASIICVFLLYVRLYGGQPVAAAPDPASRFCAEFALSAKEQPVFRLLIDGKTNKEIAKTLFISENTVKFHVRNILKKTDCQKRTDVIWKFQSYS